MKFEKGMMVCVKDNVDYSVNKLGGGNNMIKMCGGVFEIVYVESKAIYLNGKSFGSWWFKKRDLMPYMTDEELEKKSQEHFPPVLFDPKNILA